jgi:ABC-2 type transport system ATP-binding protein
MKHATVISIESLHYSYGEHLALRGISFSVNQAEIFGLLGPNGGGKSTTFKILSTMLRHSEGKVSVLGNDIRNTEHEVRKHIGVVFQSPSLDGKLTVKENMIHQGHLYGLRGAFLEQRIETLLSHFSLSERKNTFVELLSGGLQRRVEIAKALLHSPKLLLLDEPSTGLDPGARISMWNLLCALREKERITILLTTHLLEEAEKCDCLGILDEGKLVAAGSPSELKKEIGGDVISVGAENTGELFPKIQKRFGNNAMLIGSMIHIERERAHEFIPQLVSEFPNEITSITLSKPSLEDVFIHKTGKKFSG